MKRPKLTDSIPQVASASAAAADSTAVEVRIQECLVDKRHAEERKLFYIVKFVVD